IRVFYYSLITLFTISSDYVISDVLVTDDNVINKHKECVDRTKKSSKLISGRFNDQQIAAICDRQFQWTKAVFRLSDVETSFFLTANQRKWLNSVYACPDLRLCQCDDFVCYSLHKSFSGTVEFIGKRGIDRLPRRNSKLLLRKEYRMFSDDEREKFHEAMNALKSDLIDNYSKYDILTTAHTPNLAPGAHFGPAFLPWHREYLRQFETALRFYDDSIAMPYWDSTLEQGLPDPRHSVIWSKKFFGNGDDIVNEGPYRNWTISNPTEAQPTNHLLRHIATSPYGSLFRNSDVSTVLAKRKYDELASCTDQFFEMMHGMVHLWIGGTMADIPQSPSDPVFHLHHAFVDHIWQMFRDSKQTRKRRETDYPNQNASCNAYHYADAQMLPFPLKNVNGLSNRYNDEIYIYEARPTCSRPKQDCGSPYLFCDTFTFTCLSKIVPGGNCTGLELLSINPCMEEGRCIQGRCQNSDDTLAPPGPPSAPNGVSTGISILNYQGSTRYGLESLALTTADTCSCNCEGGDEHKADISDELSGKVKSLSKKDQHSSHWMALAVLKVDPDSGGYVGAIGAEVKLQTVNSTFGYSTTVSSRNTSCSSFWYNDQEMNYVTCSSMFSLDNRSRKLNDSIETFATEDQALREQWYHGTRVPQKLIFICEETNYISTKTSSSCQFLRFEDSNLVGFARQTLDNVRLAACKLFCQKSTDDFGFNCTSLIFIRGENSTDQIRDLINPDLGGRQRGTCALNSESRMTKPNLFVKQPQFIYMDMICGEYSVSLE
uniref:Apple domain-containing protein n=1 Tax=Romanomermis culicivorax TaxID=13658 RepID=A0A915I8K9_ROMCU